MIARSFLVVAFASFSCGRARPRRPAPDRLQITVLVPVAVKEETVVTAADDLFQFVAFVAAHGKEFTGAFERGDCPAVNRLLETFADEATRAAIPIPHDASAENRTIAESLRVHFAELYDAAGCALNCTGMRIVELGARVRTVSGAVHGLSDRPCFGIVTTDDRIAGAHVDIQALRSRGFRVALAPELPNPSEFIDRSYDAEIEEDTVRVQIPLEYLPLYLPIVIEPLTGAATASPTATQPFRFRLVATPVFATASRTL